ncbi:hypothetical protein SKAU_G00074230 [Synaphobranchus kaupii]|uniref:E3 ubiquitin-protein ligase RNF166 n=1 Tax=Synaphobranchus kaupii TaxID=118154 RepID=A0A9Q1G878_SYNKA|nr:hypothetical protein SKAU_G00074230 [Synaphobranchus kaupii]
MEPVPGGVDGPAEFECPICREAFTDPTRPSTCSHVFCRSCLTQSLMVRPHCPLCRALANELLIIPAADVLATMRQTTDTPRAPCSEVRSRIRARGWALPMLDPFATVRSRRVSANIQERLRRLNAASEAHQNVVPATPPPPDPPAPPTRPTLLTLPTLAATVPVPPRPRQAAPTPRPRRTMSNLTWPSIHIPVLSPPTNTTPLWPPPPPTPPNSGGAMALLPQDYFSSPSSSSSSDDEFVDDLLFDYEMRQLTRRSSVELVFNCPYCQESGLDELGLLAHCNTNHREDPRHVVCPICVSLPHTDPTYVSVDFIGHINRRHRYYNSDFMDMTKNDALNQQEAILASYNSLVQNK